MQRLIFITSVYTDRGSSIFQLSFFHISFLFIVLSPKNAINRKGGEYSFK